MKDREFNPFNDRLLLGEAWTYTDAQRAKREAYVALVREGALEPPHSEWLEEYGDGVTGDAMSRIATTIYNILVDSGPRFRDELPSGGFADILETGGDAELWTLIRIGLAEAMPADFAEVCEKRGYEVNKTVLVEADHLLPPSLN